MNDPQGAPIDYAQMFREYNPYMLTLVKQKGISPQNAEDVLQEIWTKLLARDIIALYNPTHQTVYAGVVKYTKFRTFLTRFVHVYVQHHRDKQALLHHREMMGPEELSNTDWLDALATPDPDPVDTLSVMEEAGWRTTVIESYLAERDAARSSDVSLLQLYRTCGQVLESDNRVTKTRLARELAVSVHHLTAPYQELKDSLRQLAPALV